MHIPDAVLSPVTTATTTVAMLPVWTLAARRVRESLGTRQVPLLALGAAFCFTVMMFNIPALGGTTAHPVAGTLIAILLGPWAALIGVSVALAIQTLFFGDGGLLAYGANCFVMAFTLPFVGYSVYNALSRRLPANSPLRPVCAAIGAYIGLNAAAAVVAVLLGIQPTLFHEPNGHPLYFPFGLKMTLPAMLGTHLVVAGPAEAIVTLLVTRYLQTAGFALYGVSDSTAPRQATRRRRAETLWIGLLALVALSPLGLLAKGDAWGEWDARGFAAEIKKVEGKEYVPKAIAAQDEHGYKGVRGLEDYASEKGAKGYVTAGLLGTATVVGLLLVVGRLLARRDEEPGGKDGGTGSKNIEQKSHSGAAFGALPDWLTQPSDVTVPPSEPSGRPSNPFLERTLTEIASGAATTLAGERWARQSGLLQRLDPRAKVLGFVGLLFVVVSLRNAGTLFALYALTLALAVASHLPVGMLIRRVWLSVPIFVGALALPAMLNIVTPGRALLVLWTQPYLAVTAPGLGIAALLTLRVGVTVSLATLLTLTTGWNELLRALRTLGIPRLFLSVLAMTYRYIIVLLQTAGEMFVARRSRTVGRTTNADGRRFVGASIGALFGKTLALSEEVHAAMLSRGFHGEMRTLTPLRWGLADTLWLAGIGATAALALVT